MPTIRLNVHNLSSGTQFQLQDLTDDTDLGDLLVLLEVETNIPSQDIAIQFKGRMIATAGGPSTLAACGLTNDALILVNKKGAAFPPPPAAAAAASAAGAAGLGAGLSGLLATLARPRDRTQEMVTLRDRLRSNPYELSVIREVSVCVCVNENVGVCMCMCECVCVCVCECDSCSSVYSYVTSTTKKQRQTITTTTTTTTTTTAKQQQLAAAAAKH